MIKKQVAHGWRCIRKQLGNPPIELLCETEYRNRTGYGLGSYWGRADFKRNLICVRQNRPLDHIKNTLWHEALHCIYHNKPHWWIECAAAILSNCKEDAPGRYSRRYAHSVDDLPSRSKLLSQVRQRARMLTP